MKKTFVENCIVGKIPNKEIYWEMIEYARLKGVPICSDTHKSDWDKYPNIIFTSSKLTGNRSKYGDTSHTWITMEEFFECCDNWKPSSLKLTSDYTAQIDFENKIVKVGCQSIPFEKVMELSKMIQQ